MTRQALLKSIEKLEKHPSLQPPGPAHVWRLYVKEKLNELLAQLKPEYAEIVRADQQSSIGQLRWSALTTAVDKRLYDHLLYGAPLAFPAIVAEVYVQKGNQAGDYGECEGCSYRLPLEFTICPLCDGSVVSHWDMTCRRRLLEEQERLAAHEE